MAAELAPSSKRNRTRSPSYPYLDLQGALEKAAALWHAEGRHAASISVIMQHWGYREESSTGYSCVAALKKFGLVDHEGMGETRQMRLSGLALRILLDDNPQSDERRAALREAALGPRIHAELWERYGVDLPSDQSLKRFLVLERSFNESSVDELLAEYKQTMAYAGLARASGAVLAGNAAPTLPAVEDPLPTRPTRPPAVPGAGVPAPAARPVQLAAAAVPVASAPGAAERPAAPAVEPRQGYVLPPRAVGPPAATVTRSVPNGSGAVVPTPGRDLFGERDEAALEDDERLADEAAPPARPTLPAEPAPRAAAGPAPGMPEGGSPWSGPRRELPVPLDNGMVANVPYPMTEEDFELLIDTLQLWKKRLVQPSPR